jgi:hypothetical protein
MEHDPGQAGQLDAAQLRLLLTLSRELLQTDERMYAQKRSRLH